MKHQKQIFSLILFFAIGVGTSFAQSSLVSTGGEAAGNGGSVSYSIGQIAVQNSSDGTTTVSEGVQQPYEISTVGVDNYPAITLNAVVYPNPTHGNLQLVMGNGELGLGNWEVKVFDGNGKYLFSKKIEGKITHFDLSPYATGTYYINVCSGKDVMKTFKVVKMGF